MGYRNQTLEFWILLWRKGKEGQDYLTAWEHYPVICVCWRHTQKGNAREMEKVERKSSGKKIFVLTIYVTNRYMDKVFRSGKDPPSSMRGQNSILMQILLWREGIVS